MAKKTLKEQAQALIAAKTTAEQLTVLSDMLVNTCVVTAAQGIDDSFIEILTTAESTDKPTFSAVAHVVDAAERKARENVGAHRSNAKVGRKDVNSATL